KNLRACYGASLICRQVSKMDIQVIKVGGMKCESCVRSVTSALTAVPGVQSVEVLLAAGEARVHCDAAQVPVAALKNAIEDAGFDAP
ncbi:MAG TPA: heavy metal-associated domain-containing protein, partial [Rhodocyclaceae bacterium]|nr:heavy metal-associated domain-containing protein [Rhodocyclaceae bacterium]